MKAFLISSEYSGTVLAVVLAETETKALNKYIKTEFPTGGEDRDDLTVTERPLIG